jgi:hypothetical protein
MPQWDTESAVIEEIRLMERTSVGRSDIGELYIQDAVISALRDLLTQRLYSERDKISACLRVLQEYALYTESRKKEKEREEKK